ncbi:hypothetical protein QE152_g25318 [Popillia japonica]|uniref:Uncharacterized protein n=1 Tax=Popillia japonica TaxID=7064 RepID=A0AAW1K2L0_POPJA
MAMLWEHSSTFIHFETRKTLVGNIHTSPDGNFDSVKLHATDSSPRPIAQKFAEQFVTSAKSMAKEKYGNSNDTEGTSGQLVNKTILLECINIQKVQKTIAHLRNTLSADPKELTSSVLQAVQDAIVKTWIIPTDK